MDSVPDEAVIEADRDRLSSLPLDLIHHILSLIDVKYAVQTCVLSSKWKPIWTTLLNIKFSTSEFERRYRFYEFVSGVIAHRNDQTDVSSLELTYDNRLIFDCLGRLIRYALSHNLRKLTINSNELSDGRVPEYHYERNLPFSIFKVDSQSLEFLTVTNLGEVYCMAPKYPWDLPNLTTLHLDDIGLSDGRGERYEVLDLFSKCVNLKNLSITKCYIVEVKEFMVSAPRLENLTVKKCTYPKLVISAPKLSSFFYSGGFPLNLSTVGVKCLDKLDLHFSLPQLLCYFEKEDVCKLVDSLKEFHNIKILTLYSNVIEALSLHPDLLLSQPSPFHNLEHLNIRHMSRNGKFILHEHEHVKNYFLHSSPNAIITVESN